MFVFSSRQICHVVGVATLAIVPAIGCSSSSEVPPIEVWQVSVDTQDSLTIAAKPTVTAGAGATDGGSTDAGSSGPEGPKPSAFVGAWLYHGHFNTDVESLVAFVPASSPGDRGNPGPGWLQIRFRPGTATPHTFEARRGGTTKSDRNQTLAANDATVMYVASDGVEASAASGSVTIATHKVARGYADGEGTMAVTGQFSSVQFTMPDGRNFVANGAFDVSGSSMKSSGSSSGSSGATSSSGGTTGSCSKAWTCAADGQASAMCQAACAYSGTQRQQTCQILLQMNPKGGSCCTAC